MSGMNNRPNGGCSSATQSHLIDMNNIHIILNLILQQLVSDTIFPGKLIFYDRVLKSIACVVLVYSLKQRR
jgi:hypothetical protein